VPNGRGRFFYDVQHSPNNTVWEHKKVVSYDDAGRVLTHHQNFWQNGVWGPGYETSNQYDLAGNVTQMTYPSGHTVNYAYDRAMRLATSGGAPAFKGNLGDGVLRTYATDIAYDPMGGMQRETFGTATPLYHKRKYNERGQVYDVRLSNVNDDWNWNRGALVNWYSSNGIHGGSGADNNGNVLIARHHAPGNDQYVNSSMSEDHYTYDSLNRIASVNGYHWQTLAFTQSYTYDRFGNRQINNALTTTNVNRTQFAIDTNTNRITKPGDATAMQYDNAGNLTTDTYTSSGGGGRTYDPEGRMTGADGSGYWNRYTYDADGKRTRHYSYVNNPEQWYVYGIGGELVAEYAANASPATPKKEYGYRNGELLITAASNAPAASARDDFSLASNPIGAWSYGYQTLNSDVRAI
jgi:YD repeat-containing protein